MRPAAPLYAVILLQIVLGVFDIASYVVRATSTRSLVSRDALHVGLIVLQFSRDDVPFRFGCCASESPSMSPLSRFGMVIPQALPLVPRVFHVIRPPVPVLPSLVHVILALLLIVPGVLQVTPGALRV